MSYFRYGAQPPSERLLFTLGRSDGSVVADFVLGDLKETMRTIEAAAWRDRAPLLFLHRPAFHRFPVTEETLEVQSLVLPCAEVHEGWRLQDLDFEPRFT